MTYLIDHVLVRLGYSLDDVEISHLESHEIPPVAAARRLHDAGIVRKGWTRVERQEACDVHKRLLLAMGQRIIALPPKVRSRFTEETIDYRRGSLALVHVGEGLQSDAVAGDLIRVLLILLFWETQLSRILVHK